MLSRYLTFLQELYISYEYLFIWLGVFSILLFVCSIVLLPFLIRRIPSDYFTNPSYHHIKLHTFRHIVIFILCNMVGIVMVFLGIIMLITPGQGLITIMIGLMLMQFKGKHHLEQKLLANGLTLSGINWIRNKTHTPPLDAPSTDANERN